MKNENKGAKLSFMKTDKFKRSTAATIFTVVFVVLIIVLNMVVSALTDRYPSMNIDITPDKLNTLSEDSLNIAKGLDKDVEIFIIGSEEMIRGDKLYAQLGINYSQVANLAEKLQEANPDRVKMSFIDPDMNPGFIQEYADDGLASGSVLVRSKDRHRVLSVADLFSVQENTNTGERKMYSKVDGAMANALYLVNLDTVPVIAVATGHNEVLKTDARAGFDALMKDCCFDVVEFNILTDEVPENASVVMLPTPTTDYTDQEIDKLTKFLDDADSTKSLFITSHPAQAKFPNLALFLEDWGLKIDGGVITETDSNNHLMLNGAASKQWLFANPTGEILEGEYPNFLAPMATPIELLFDNNNSITTYALAETANTTYLAMTDSDLENENPDTKSFVTAALAQRVSTDGEAPVKTNVIVMGDTLSMGYLNDNVYGNRAFVSDLMRFATDTTDKTVGITVDQTQTNVRDITAPASVIIVVGLVIFTILLPLAILIAGFVVFLKRRHL